MAESMRLGINHPSPLIYCVDHQAARSTAGNQSSIPFDILLIAGPWAPTSWESIIHPL